MTYRPDDGIRMDAICQPVTGGANRLNRNTLL